MAFDWGTVASGAGTGALAGGAAGGIGAIPGALIGGAGAALGELFGGKEDVPAFQDLSDPRISAIAQSLMRKKLGAKYASRQKALNTKTAQSSVEKIDNQGPLSLSQRSGAYNSINRNAEEANVSANLSGASQDQAAQEKAASLMEANDNLSLQRNQFARQGWQIDQQPSAFQSLAGTALSNTLGQVVQGGLNPQPTSVATDPGPSPANSTVKSSEMAMNPPPQVPAPMDSGISEPPPEWNTSKTLRPTWSSGIGGDNYFDRLKQRFASPQPAY